LLVLLFAYLELHDLKASKISLNKVSYFSQAQPSQPFIEVRHFRMVHDLEHSKARRE